MPNWMKLPQGSPDMPTRIGRINRPTDEQIAVTSMHKGSSHNISTPFNFSLYITCSFWSENVMSEARVNQSIFQDICDNQPMQPIFNSV